MTKLAFTGLGRTGSLMARRSADAGAMRPRTVACSYGGHRPHPASRRRRAADLVGGPEAGFAAYRHVFEAMGTPSHAGNLGAVIPHLRRSREATL